MTFEEAVKLLGGGLSAAVIAGLVWAVTIVRDISTLTAPRNRVLLDPSDSGGLVKYLCETTGGQVLSVKSLLNSNPAVATLVAGEYAEFAWDGATWVLLFKRVAVA